MKPAKVDLPTIWRGCDWGPVTLKWKDQNGNPIYLGGWTPMATSLNLDLNAAVTLPAQGVTTISMTKQQTRNIKLGVESWDWIWVRDSDGYRFPPFLAGKVPIKEPNTTP